MPVSISRSWHRASDTDDAVLGVDAMGFCALGVELVLGLDHSSLLRLPQLVPEVLPGASLAPIRILWECFPEVFVMLLWKRSSPAPCTAEQHC